MSYIETLIKHGFKIEDHKQEFGLHKKVSLICPNGHKVFTRLDSVYLRLDRPSKGCRECNNLNREQKSLVDNEKHLPEGFSIVGSYRKKVDWKESKTIRVYQIRCPENHIFKKDSGQLQELRCTICSEQGYIGQERTRKIFEILFKNKFPSIRPDWLKNPKTKRNLELDGFNQELSIAFEFQGRQHFDENTEFADDYKKQTERDELKRELCEKLNLKLIEINQPPSYGRFRFINNVLQQIKNQIDITKYPNINFNLNISNFHFDDIKFEKIRPTVKAFLDYLQDESPIKGYSCLETGFHTYEDKITMCCPKGHQFHTTAAEFKRNVEGKKGRETPCKVCFTESGQASTKVDLEFCREEGKKHGLELLSTEYKNVNEELEWKDSNGDIVRLPFRKLQRRKLVKKSNTKGIDLEYCREQGAKYQLELLSTEYINVHQKLLWRKENGDEIELYLRQIQRSKTGVF